MVTSTRPRARKGTGQGPKIPGPNGKGPNRNGHGKQDGDPRRRFSADRYRITVWVILAAVVMTFAAISSAFIILAGGEQWRPVTMPRMFFVSTAIIVGSSAAFEFAKRSWRQRKERRYMYWLAAVFLLGLGFLGAQVLGWRELAAQGVYLAADPRRSFFYLFTAIHGVHLMGGLAAMLYLLLRRRNADDEGVLRTSTFTSVIGVYWHTMDVLWLWLVSLLIFWK